MAWAFHSQLQCNLRRIQALDREAVFTLLVYYAESHSDRVTQTSGRVPLMSAPMYLFLRQAASERQYYHPNSLIDSPNAVYDELCVPTSLKHTKFRVYQPI